MENRRNLTLLEAWELRENAWDKLLKAKNPDLYYENLYIKCYYFICQQYKDYFEIAGAKGHKRVPFAAFSLKDRIFFCWQQYKNRIKHNRATFLS